MQTVWVFTVSLPVTFSNSPTSASKSHGSMFGTVNDIVGSSLFGLGLVLETLADCQKFQFKDDPRNMGKWCTLGSQVFFTEKL